MFLLVGLAVTCTALLLSWNTLWRGGRFNPADRGWMSEQWIAEYRASRDGSAK